MAEGAAEKEERARILKIAIGMRDEQLANAKQTKAHADRVAYRHCARTLENLIAVIGRA